MVWHKPGDWDERRRLPNFWMESKHGQTFNVPPTHRTAPVFIVVNIILVAGHDPSGDFTHLRVGPDKRCNITVSSIFV
ncbi:hypothetical protein PAXRUDRAFT_829052 [Paxillus rubicundulus Ve08.2h10]|uniref:Uncharacterized protein n=1 Tax=Paxillus rubicundulus Ve08.2h10 TaxID=930991 RepID=A0A0D0DVA4_9AGAM|nr:hypothetical protein PAXRUDRAFT_829052 [Paxillus rubicundulus Ve08.2h10]